MTNQPLTLKISVNTKGIENLDQRVNQIFPDVVKKYALMMLATSIRRPRMPVDTGALKNSMEAKPTDNPLIWNVRDGVEYGVYQELGTKKGVPARHFLGHAAEITAEKFFSEVRKIMKGLRNDTGT